MDTTTGHKDAGESTPPGGLLTPEQVAAHLGIGRTYAYQLLRTGQIPSLKLGKLRRVRPLDLARYLDALAEDQHPQK
jgi:excisionase family DNA binding protein